MHFQQIQYHILTELHSYRYRNHTDIGLVGTIINKCLVDEKTSYLFIYLLL